MGQQPMAQCVAVTRHHYYLNQLTQKTINQGGKMNNLIHKKLGIAVISGCLMMLVGIAQAADLVVFSNGGVADANDVNANFNELETRIETITLTPGPVGADSTVAGPKGDTGADSTVAGPKGDTGANSTVAGPKGDTGANSTVAGPKGDTGADSTVAGPKGDTGANSTVAGPKGDTGADSTVAGPKGDTGANSTVAGPAGAAGLGAVVFNSAPTAADDMNTYTVGTVWIDTLTATAYILVDNSPGAAVWTILGGSATGSLYAIGDDGPAGGIVFYVTDEGLHGLEAAPENLAVSKGGCAGFTHGDEVVIGTGASNTHQISIGCWYVNTAAKAADIYSLGTYSDWFLPSRDELILLLDNGPKDFRSGGLHSGSYFISSSQFDTSLQYVSKWDSFSGRLSSGTRLSKDTMSVSRAIRAF
jgi:hypothetical protein